jgi:hypothetical protein
MIEDSNFSLNLSIVDYVNRVPRDDEQLYLEIKADSVPNGIRFFVENVNPNAPDDPPNDFEQFTYFQADTIGVGADKWILIPVEFIADLQMDPPNNYSGNYDMITRATLRTVDGDDIGDVDAESEPETTSVDVLPVSDGSTTPSIRIVEDQWLPEMFGSTLADSMNLRDRASGTGNNVDTESLTELVVSVPADSLEQTYLLSGAFELLVDGGTATIGDSIVTLSEPVAGGVRTFTIRSVTNVPLGSATDLTHFLPASGVDFIDKTEREAATEDLYSALRLFELFQGPEHNSDNGLLQFTTTSVDVNLDVKDNAGEVDSTLRTWRPVIVLANADPPGVTTGATVTVDEDTVSIPLDITVTKSLDVDDSETLSVRITVPQQPVFTPNENDTPIGTIEYTGTLPEGVSLTETSDGVYLFEATGDTPDIREARLNSVLEAAQSGGQLVFNPRFGWAQTLTGTNGLQVDAISTEDATGNNNLANHPTDFVALYVEDQTTKTETRTAYIDIDVTPLADTPTVRVKGNAIGREDEVNIVEIEVTLDDPDNSETYVMRIDADLPTTLVDGVTYETKLFGDGGVELVRIGTGIGSYYELTPDDVEAFALLPPLHYSTIHQGDPAVDNDPMILQTTTIVSDGATATPVTFSFPITVDIEGVADVPGNKDILVPGIEDQVYNLGAQIDLTGVLIDVVRLFAATKAFAFSGCHALLLGVTPRDSLKLTLFSSSLFAHTPTGRLRNSFHPPHGRPQRRPTLFQYPGRRCLYRQRLVECRPGRRPHAGPAPRARVFRR